MKKAWILVLGIVVVALGIFAVSQRRASRVAGERVATAEAAQRAATAARQEDSDRAQAAEARAERLQREVQEFSTVTSNLRSNAAAQRSNLTAMAERMQSLAGTNSGAAGSSGTNSGGLGKGMGQMLAKMMQDPAMKKMVRGQQKAMVDMMYSGLFNQLKLSPDERSSFTELLLDVQMAQVESAGGLLGGDSTVDPAQARKTIEENKKATDAKIKELLGDDRFAEYEGYQKTISERMQVSQLQTRMETAKLPLADAQVSQLMQFMQEERERVPPVLPSGPNVNPADVKALMTAENLDKQMQWYDDYNQRVLARATAVLSPDQLKVYQDFQEQQSSMQKLGMKMAREMFGGGEAAPAPAAPAK